MNIGFIGMGNMGQALLNGFIRSSMAPTDIRFTCKSNERKSIVSQNGIVLRADDNLSLVTWADIVILAIKPQMFQDVFKEITGAMGPEKIVISLAPGKTIAYISCELNGARVVRAMPNTPAKIGYGMTGIAYDETLFNEKEIQMIDRIFSSIGEFEKVDEELISAVVCASGSSPAYVYEFIAQLAHACESKGLESGQAVKFVANAVLGAAQMVLSSEESPEELKDKVCSKGGTTLAGLERLYACGFSEAITQATDACYRRSEELSK